MEKQKLKVQMALSLFVVFVNVLPVWGAPSGNPLEGKKVFQGFCIQCHGIHGDGNGIAAPALMEKPANFTDPNLWKMGDDAFFIHIIRKGRKIMPGFWDTLNSQQILDVLSYEKTFKRK